MRKEETKLIEIFAGTAWQAGMVKSLLENEGIEAFLKDEIIGTLSPWWSAPGGAGAVKVIVSNADYGHAMQVIEEYNKCNNRTR